MSLINLNEELNTYPIYFRSTSAPNTLARIKPNCNDITLLTLKTFRVFKSLGFFTEPDNKIVYRSHKDAIAKEDSYYYSLVYGLKDLSNRKNVATIEVNSSKTNKGLFAVNLSCLDNMHANGLLLKVKKRFRNHKFTPVNGWEFMYYLDLITNLEYEWTEKEIRMLDQLKTKGLSMDIASIIISKGFSYENMEAVIGLPTSWVEKAYGNVEAKY
jgi:hypothetical protein